MTPTLSILIITGNEEQNIRPCLESVSWADEIVVVDSFSADATAAIAREYTAHVYQRAWEGYALQKNFGHARCSGEWVLSIDADERASPQLRDEILSALRSSAYVAYRIPIRDFMFGRWVDHGGWDRQHHIRLYRRAQARWESLVHETVTIDGPVGALKGPILHFSHTSVARFVEKMNRYTTLEAQALYQRQVPFSLLKLIRRMPLHFIRRYVLWHGYRDGVHGFVLAVLMGVYHFLTEVKLWELYYRAGLGTDDGGAQSQAGEPGRWR